MNVDLDLRERLERIFGVVFVKEEIPPHLLSRASAASWDSLAQIDLVATIEQEFEVALTDDDALDLTSFEAAVAIVGERIRELD